MLFYTGATGSKRGLDTYTQAKLKELYTETIYTLNNLLSNEEDYSTISLYSEVLHGEILETFYHDKLCKFAIYFGDPNTACHFSVRTRGEGWYFDYIPKIQVTHKLLLGDLRVKNFKGSNSLSNYIL